MTFKRNDGRGAERAEHTSLKVSDTGPLESRPIERRPDMVGRNTTFIIVLAMSLAVCSITQASPALPKALKFDGGSGTTQIDQYTGMAGEGWTGGWVAKASGGTILSASVSNANPVAPSNGNYLAVSVSAPYAGGYGRRGAVNRQFSSYGVVDLTKTHIIAFDVRVDAFGLSGTGHYDQVNVFGGTVSDYGMFSGETTWNIDVRDMTPPGYEGAQAFDWTYRSGTYGHIPSGLTMTVGQTYRFVVTVEPTIGKFAVTASDGTTTTTKTNMSFWTGTPYTAGTYFHAAGSTATQNSTVAFSVDNIEFIPEPATLSLLALGAMSLVRRHSRHVIRRRR